MEGEGGSGADCVAGTQPGGISICSLHTSIPTQVGEPEREKRCLCVWVFTINKESCVSVQGEAPNLGGAVGIPRPSREDRSREQNPGVDQSHGGRVEPFQPPGWPPTGWTSGLASARHPVPL